MSDRVSHAHAPARPSIYSVWSDADGDCITIQAGTGVPCYADGRPMLDCTRLVRTIEAASLEEAAEKYHARERPIS